MKTVQKYEMPLSEMQGLVAMLGRILISSLFFVSAIAKIIDPSATMSMMSELGVPFIPYLYAASIVIELIGALALLTGIAARQAAVLLIFYLIPVSYMLVNGLTISTYMTTVQMILLLQNLATMGGLFILAAFGAGPLVVEAEKPLLCKTAEDGQVSCQKATSDEPKKIEINRTDPRLTASGSAKLHSRIE
jgi:putative oxidoreductase